MAEVTPTNETLDVQPTTTTEETITAPLAPPTTTPIPEKISEISSEHPASTIKQPNILNRLLHRVGRALRGDGIPTEKNDLLGHEERSTLGKVLREWNESDYAPIEKNPQPKPK